MKNYLLLFAGLFVSLLSQAQTISHMDVFVQSRIEHTEVIENNDTTLTVQEFKEPQMFIVLTDTTNISSFLVRLGTTEGGTDIIEKTFNFDEGGELPDGTSYKRAGLYVTLLLGKYTTMPAYHAQVRATVGGSAQSAVNYSGE